MQRVAEDTESRHHAGLVSLAAPFHDVLEELAVFHQISSEDMPGCYQQLLDHAAHMTITMEQFHRSPLKLKVLNYCNSPPWYCREILLSRSSDDRVVQYELVRLNLNLFDQEVGEQIKNEQTPLGRVLIEHDVMRRVTLDSLWRVNPGPTLAKLFGLSQPYTTYGRSAAIFCLARRAIEVVEIATPLDQFEHIDEFDDR